MAITNPSVTQPLAVRAAQVLTLENDSATNWWARTNGGSWSQINGGGTTSTLVWSAPSSVTRRFTFDEVQVVAQASSPGAGETGGLHLNVCEGPVAGLQITPAAENPAQRPPQPVPNVRETDDAPLGLVLGMLGANRDGLATLVPEQPAQPGGPADLVARYGRGLAVDSSGNLLARSSVAPRVSGLGPFPAAASYHHGGLYFTHDFGKSRILSLTRVLHEDSAGNVVVIRGDGRRNCYRDTGSGYEAAAGLLNTLAASGGWGDAPWGSSAYGGGGAGFLETTPTGRVYSYDADGVLQSVEDRYGNEVTYSYDANDRLQKIAGPAGSSGLVPYLSYDGNGLLERLVLEDAVAPANNRTTYFSYDADKNLTKISGPEGCVTDLDYVGTGGARLAGVEDADGFRWAVSYDGSDRVSQVSDARLNSAAFAYDAAVPLTTHRDRVGKATYYRYNAWGFPTAVFNVGTPGDYFAYDDPLGNLTASTNRLGNAWSYVYDERGNRIKSTDPLGASHYFAYDSQDLLRRHDDPLGNETNLVYDSDRNCIEREDAQAETAFRGWHPNGLLYYQRDRLANMTYLGYDAAANQTKVTDALGDSVTVGYNSAGEPTTVTDPLSRVTTREYDLRGRLVKAVDSNGGASYFAYDGRCNLVSQKDARLQETTHEYDGNSNRTQSTDALGNASYLGYDAEDRPSERKDARLNASSMSYDVLGRLQKQTDALGGESYVAYDAAHQQVLQLDPNDNASYLAYDVVGRVQFQKNAELEATYFGYDLAGRQVKLTDARGNSSTQAYDLLHRLTSSTDALGAVRSSIYDEEGNVTRSIDPLGKTTYFTYDAKYRQVHTKNALNQNTYVNYDAANQVYFRRDAGGNRTYFFYDAAGRQQKVRDAYGEETYHAYDIAGNARFSLDELGFPTYHSYDAANRRVSTKDAYGNVATTVYDRASNVEWQIDELGFTTYMTYDKLNRRTHTKDGVHFASSYMGYDAAGNAVLDVDQGGQASYMTYDRLNRVEFSHDRAGALSYLSFDEVGNQTQRKVLLGAGGEERVSSSVYDVNNRLQKQIDALGGETYFGYDLAGNRELSLDQEERPTYMRYDKLNRAEIRTDSAIVDEWVTEFEVRGQVFKQVDPEGRTAYFAYDDVGRKIKEWNLLNQETYMGYDARGQQVLAINPNGNSTYFFYDRLGRQVRRMDALLKSSYLDYDAVGNQVEQRDELGNASYFEYDGLRRLSRVKDAKLKETYFGYDAESQLVLKIQAEGGESTYMSYDSAGRLAKQWFTTDAPNYFSYDAVGNLTLAEDDSGADTVMEYDKLDRLTKKVTLAGEVAYDYDASGQREALVDPDGNISYYVFDSRGRLEKMQVAAGRTAYFEYDKAGMVTKRTTPDDVLVAELTYDTAGRLSLLRNLHVSPSIVWNSMDYTRDANGQITAIGDELTSENVTYVYDQKERLIREQRVPVTGSRGYDFYYSFDAASNRVMKHDRKPVGDESIYYAFDERNLLEEEWNKTTGVTAYFTHDASQRMVSKKVTGGAQASYFSHDQRDLVTQIEFEKASGADTDHAFSYSAVGERVRVDDGQETYWAYDGRKLLREGKTDGSALRTYRHNYSMVPGSVIEIQEGSSKFALGFNQRGDVVVQAIDFGGEIAVNKFVTTVPGERIEVPDSLGSDQRFLVASSALVGLGLSEEAMDIGTAGFGLWLSETSISGSSILRKAPSTPEELRIARAYGDATQAELALVEKLGEVLAPLLALQTLQEGPPVGLPGPGARRHAKTDRVDTPAEDKAMEASQHCQVDLHYIPIVEKALLLMGGVFYPQPGNTAWYHTGLKVWTGSREHWHSIELQGPFSSAAAGPEAPVVGNSFTVVRGIYKIAVQKNGEILREDTGQAVTYSTSCKIAQCIRDKAVGGNIPAHGYLEHMGTEPVGDAAFKSVAEAPRWNSNAVISYLLQSCGADAMRRYYDAQVRPSKTGSTHGWLAGAVVAGRERIQRLKLEREAKQRRLRNEDGENFGPCMRGGYLPGCGGR